MSSLAGAFALYATNTVAGLLPATAKGEDMNLEHVQIEMKDKGSLFVEDFKDMHTHDILAYAYSKNLRYLEWADMVSLVHELADRLDCAYSDLMEPRDD